jgi:uncharacterized membrane protein YqaE (UPF0057 family)
VVNLKWVLDRDKGTVAPPPEYLDFVKKKRMEFFWLNGTTAGSVVLLTFVMVYLQHGVITRDVTVDIFLWNILGMFVGALASYLA